jgi:putative holliday junction resolvase
LSAPHRRFLGIDLGKRRVGVAVSDFEGRIATPLVQIEPRDLRELVDRIARLAEDEEVGGVVVGDPRHATGEVSPGTALAAQLAGELGTALGVPVWLWDERWSTAAAEDTLRGVEEARVAPGRRRGPRAGASSRGRARAREKRRGQVNQLAAAVILQSFLDEHRGKPLPRPERAPGPRPESETDPGRKP